MPLTGGEMTFIDVIKLAATILISLGGGGAIVFGLSSFLGNSGPTAPSKTIGINMRS